MLLYRYSETRLQGNLNITENVSLDRCPYITGSLTWADRIPFWENAPWSHWSDTPWRQVWLYMNIVISGSPGATWCGVTPLEDRFDCTWILLYLGHLVLPGVEWHPLKTGLTVHEYCYIWVTWCCLVWSDTPWRQVWLYMNIVISGSPGAAWCGVTPLEDRFDCTWILLYLGHLVLPGVEWHPLKTGFTVHEYCYIWVTWCYLMWSDTPWRQVLLSMNIVISGSPGATWCGGPHIYITTNNAWYRQYMYTPVYVMVYNIVYKRIMIRAQCVVGSTHVSATRAFIIIIIINKATRSPEISREQVQKLTP